MSDGRRFPIVTDVDAGAGVRLAIYADGGALLGDVVVDGERAIDLGGQLTTLGLTALRRAREASRAAAAQGAAGAAPGDSGAPPPGGLRRAIQRALERRRATIRLAGDTA